MMGAGRKWLVCVSSSKDLIKCCNCGCSCSLEGEPAGTWIRSVKRKHDEFEQGTNFVVPGLDLDVSVVRVEIENEVAALREAIISQQKTIKDLNAELEEERNSSSTAANETMSMILRLQREKAEIQMEARQFKRYAEEKMQHDQEEILALDDLLYKKEQTIESLTCEIQAYKHRMMSFGLTEAEADGNLLYDLPAYEYPPLKCNARNAGMDADNDDTDIEKYAFGETPRDRLRNIEDRISEMERTPTYKELDADFTGRNTLEKTSHFRKTSTDSVGREAGSGYLSDSPKVNSNFRRDYFSQSEDQSNLKKDNASEADDTTDRIYTIDSVHSRAPHNGFTGSKAGGAAFEDSTGSPRELRNHEEYEDPYVKKLYMRLQALEADRESMRQALISMRTDKAQLVLLKEIAQQLCKDMSPQRKMTNRKSAIGGRSSLASIVKWISSVVIWRKRAHQSKYRFGLPADSTGLLMLLDKGITHTRPWRCISRTQVGN
ncbi:hypothetical protein Ahy_A02g004923 isoform A [Arachis hypogaea]|uniref:GTD-binding domain-containing protein n=1 Tax=Arachis hypogaea TaxID=3818 RepID=A0A445E549_ARAHY|nr:hypothetical protein Ahy_A02g004923 isoform A [Arachis hypogaea]